MNKPEATYEGAKELNERIRAFAKKITSANSLDAVTRGLQSFVSLGCSDICEEIDSIGDLRDHPIAIAPSSLDRLEKKFKSRLHSYRDGSKHNPPNPELAKAWKRAWLDVKKEMSRA